MTTLSFYLLSAFVLFAIGFTGYLMYQKILFQRFNRYFNLQLSLLWDQSDQKQDQLARGSLLLELLESREETKGFLITRVQFSKKEFHVRNFDKIYLDTQNSGQKLSTAFYIAKKHLHTVRDKDLAVDLTGFVVHKDNKRSLVRVRQTLKIEGRTLPDEWVVADGI